MSKPAIGVIGSGDVGMQLGKAFAKLGHKVKLGTREPAREDVVAWVKEAGPNASAGTNEEAARFGEVVILATSWDGTANALALAKPASFHGKVVLDVTNPLDHSVTPPRLAKTPAGSAAQEVAKMLPGARVVKTLNMVNNAQMVDPHAFGQPTMFVAGDDAQAKGVAEGLVREMGWTDIVDLGGLDHAYLLEAVAMVWIVHGFRSGKWTHAIKLHPAR